MPIAIGYYAKKEKKEQRQFATLYLYKSLLNTV